MRFNAVFILLLSAFSLYSQSILDIEVSGFTCSNTLETCLGQLEQKTDLNFNYKSSLVRAKRIEIDQRATSVGNILTEIASQCKFDFDVLGTNVLLRSPAPPKSIHGIIYDIKSNETISDVEIISNQSTVYSNKHGYFNLFLDADSSEIKFLHSSYLMLSQTVEIIDNNFYVIKMRRIPLLAEVKVDKSEFDQGISLKPYDEIRPDIEKVPSLGGETDALNNLKLLPGIQNVSFGDPGLIVRGGGPDQNFVLVDGIPVYNTFHILGLYSIFNADNINNIKVYKDAFPPKYNSRLSSVIDVSLNNGNKIKHKATADVGLISSGISLNGPIIKEKMSYSISARRTFADLILNPFQRVLNRNAIQKNTTALWYYDVFAKVHLRHNEKNDFKITAYNGGDQLGFKSEFTLPTDNTTEKTNGDLGWRNNLIGFQWNHIFSSKLLMSFQSAYSGYNVEFEDGYGFTSNTENALSTTSYQNGLTEIRNSIDFDYFSDRKTYLQAGLGVVNYSFKPFTRRYSSSSPLKSYDTTITSSQIDGTESYAYLEGKFYFEGGSANIGMRGAYFNTSDATYFRFQPRVQVLQNFNKDLQLRFSLATSNQFVHLVPNNNLGLPLDIWLPVTDKLRPLNVTQLSTKLTKKHKDLEIDGGIFSKVYRNILEHKSGINLLTGADWQNDLLSGTARAFGFEASAKYKAKKTNLYAGYTFCRSMRTVSGINNNEEYFSKYDRPHNLNLLFQYALSNASSLNVSFTFASGNPVSLPTAKYSTLINGQEVIVEEFDRINNFRLPNTHHLDVSYILNREYRKFDSQLTLGVYNLYNQLNPFMVYIGVNEQANPVIKIRSYLPMMPMFKYSIKI